MSAFEWCVVVIGASLFAFNAGSESGRTLRDAELSPGWAAAMSQSQSDKLVLMRLWKSRETVRYCERTNGASEECLLGGLPPKATPAAFPLLSASP